jgi:hypothetical protein
MDLRGVVLSRGGVAGFDSRGPGAKLPGAKLPGAMLRCRLCAPAGAIDSRGAVTDSRGAATESRGAATDSRSGLGEGVDLGLGCKVLLRRGERALMRNDRKLGSDLPPAGLFRRSA